MLINDDQQSSSMVIGKLFTVKMFTDKFRLFKKKTEIISSINDLNCSSDKWVRVEVTSLITSQVKRASSN